MIISSSASDTQQQGAYCQHHPASHSCRGDDDNGDEDEDEHRDDNHETREIKGDDHDYDNRKDKEDGNGDENGRVLGNCKTSMSMIYKFYNCGAD